MTTTYELISNQRHLNFSFKPGADLPGQRKKRTQSLSIIKLISGQDQRPLIVIPSKQKLIIVFSDM